MNKKTADPGIELDNLKNEVTDKHRIISNVWNDFIWDNVYCRNQINFTQEAESNYLGDILGYFLDTFEIIFKKDKQNDSTNFASHISFLQAIYVQQDFIEEMLILFKTNLVKGDLKLNEDYTINREIRNELVGHPIRRQGGKLISSTLFGYERSAGKIIYLRYHNENNFNFEAVELDIEEIVIRHCNFLVFYFDVIIGKLKDVLNKYSVELEFLKQAADRVAFLSLLKIISQKFKPFLQNTFIYDAASMRRIYEKKDLHKRYSHVYNSFLTDLKKQIAEKQEYALSIFNNDLFLGDQRDHYEMPLFDDNDNYIQIKVQKKLGRPKTDYHYELGKLSTVKTLREFDHHSNVIKAKSKNKTVLEELNRMKEFFEDKVEYYASFYLVRSILKED